MQSGDLVTGWFAALWHPRSSHSSLYTELPGDGWREHQPGTRALPGYAELRCSFSVQHLPAPQPRVRRSHLPRDTCLWESWCSQTSWESFVIIASGPAEIRCCLIIGTIYYWYQKRWVIKQRSLKHPYSAKNSSSVLVLRKAGETRKPGACEKENVDCISGLGGPGKSPKAVPNEGRQAAAHTQVSGLRIYCLFWVCVTWGYWGFFDFSLPHFYLETVRH